MQAPQSTGLSGLDRAFEVAGIGRWEFFPGTGALEMDATCCLLFGFDAAPVPTHEEIMGSLHPGDAERVGAALAAVTEGGASFEERFRICLPDGSERWIRGVGRWQGASIVGVSIDVTAEQQLHEERGLHLAEMNHRVKNLFSLVNAIVSTAARESEDKEAMQRSLVGRISALDRAHSLMLKTDVSQPIALGALLERVLAPALSRQTVRMSGAEVMIPAESITPLVLIVHEWVTNSAKYGALREEEGLIEVDWSVGEGSVTLHWREKVADYDPDAEKGFGSRLILASAIQLGAEKTRRYEDGWLEIDMTMPVGE